jgi:hypothetical protein
MERLLRQRNDAAYLPRLRDRNRAPTQAEKALLFVKQPAICREI